MPIHQEATFPVAPERVYEALTNGAEFSAATGKPAHIGQVGGARFSVFGDWIEGRQIELVPNERVVQAWRFKEWDAGVYSLVRFTLTREAEGTRLSVDHDAYPAAYHDHLSTNWRPFYFEPFAKHFGARP